MPSRLGIDVGGTYTDFLLVDAATGASFAHKARSTPEDLSIGIEKGLAELFRTTGIKPGEIEQLVHGTTLPVHLLRQRQGVRLGLLVTKGFEQVLHVERSRPSQAADGLRIAPLGQALVDLDMTRGIVERISARGDAIIPLDEEAARQSIGLLLQSGAQALTISLLHSSINPAHEQRLRSIVREMNGDIPVTLSCELAPEAGEFERTLTTVINAYIQPGMDSYLQDLQHKLTAAQITPSASIAHCGGGRFSARQATVTPVQTIHASVSAGVAGAAQVASLAGYPDALALDMGGTSTDIALIRNGTPRIANELILGTDPLKVSSIDARAVGAGGASIAHLPMPGMLRVGPRSADAQPGPVCYGRGGTEPTVTDANVVLGRLLTTNPSLDGQAAHNAVGAIGQALDLDRHRAAEGIVNIANEATAGALRIAAVAKGIEPDRLALIAYGGAGPLHGCALGMLTGCWPVVVPRSAGVLSAWGLLTADVSRQFATMVAADVDKLQVQDVTERLDALAKQATAWLAEEASGMQLEPISYRADVRYYRQAFQVSVPVDPAELASAGLHGFAAGLAQAHQRRFGGVPDQPVELVALRAIAIGRNPAELPTKLQGMVPAGQDSGAALIDHSQVYFDGAFKKTAVYDRSKLAIGYQLNGPAIVTQTDTATVVHPGHVATVDDYLNLIIQPSGTGRAEHG